MKCCLFNDSFDNYGHIGSGNGSRELRSGWVGSETMKDDIFLRSTRNPWTAISILLNLCSVCGSLGLACLDKIHIRHALGDVLRVITHSRDCRITTLELAFSRRYISKISCVILLLAGLEPWIFRSIALRVTTEPTRSPSLLAPSE